MAAAAASTATAVTPDDVLKFWFGDVLEHRRVWFQSTPEFDAEIINHFGPTIETALAGGLSDWDATPDGRLAHILVLDQFTRNAFRGTGKAFAGDAMAAKLSIGGLDNGQFNDLPEVKRLFASMPLQHAEDLASQERGLNVEFPKLKGFREQPGFQKIVKDHHDVIKQFGRFPHRNAALGRVSTPEEEAYLASDGANNWGQATKPAAATATTH